MSTIITSPYSIDRKQHRIALISDSAFGTPITLARDIAGRNLTEFSYKRKNKIMYASPLSISGYINYAIATGLLADDLALTLPKADIRSLGNFQWWLKDKVMDYLGANDAGLEEIKKAVSILFSNTPYVLPTIDKVFETLATSMPKSHFRMSVKIISALSPKALTLSSRKLVIHPDIVELPS